MLIEAFQNCRSLRWSLWTDRMHWCLFWNATPWAAVCRTQTPSLSRAVPSGSRGASWLQACEQWRRPLGGPGRGGVEVNQAWRNNRRWGGQSTRSMSPQDWSSKCQLQAPFPHHKPLITEVTCTENQSMSVLGASWDIIPWTLFPSQVGPLRPREVASSVQSPRVAAELDWSPGLLMLGKAPDAGKD